MQKNAFMSFPKTMPSCMKIDLLALGVFHFLVLLISFCSNNSLTESVTDTLKLGNFCTCTYEDSLFIVFIFLWPNMSDPQMEGQV